MKKYRGIQSPVVNVLLTGFLLLCTSAALSASPWISEFNDICGKTSEADSLSKDDLKVLIGRCDKLQPEIENSGDPQKAVYLFRLQKCRKLFVYMLESPAK